jgi:hypothetical protein
MKAVAIQNAAGTTVYEHPRRMIFFTGAYDLQIARDGDRVVVTGAAARETLA